MTLGLRSGASQRKRRKGCTLIAKQTAKVHGRVEDVGRARLEPRRRSSRAWSPPLMSGSAAKTIAMIAVFPTLVSTMQMVPMQSTQTTMLTVCSMMCTIGRYLAGTSASYAAFQVVPELATMVTEGVGDVVDEAVEGSRMVVRCIYLYRGHSNRPSWLLVHSRRDA